MTTNTLRGLRSYERSRIPDIYDALMTLRPGDGLTFRLVGTGDTVERHKLNRAVRGARASGLKLMLATLGEPVLVPCGDGTERPSAVQMQRRDMVVWCENYATPDAGEDRPLAIHRDPLPADIELPDAYGLMSGGRNRGDMREWLAKLEPDGKEREYELGETTGPEFARLVQLLRVTASAQALQEDATISVRKPRGRERRVFVIKLAHRI